LGWLALIGNWMGVGLWVLLAAYIIGGFDSDREGLTTLWQERELYRTYLTSRLKALHGRLFSKIWQIG